MASSSSSPSSTSVPPLMKRKERRNWEELPPELTSSILLRLGAIEILENAQKVCRSWRRVCKDPSMWRKIDMRIPRNIETLKYDPEAMCRNAVDRSQGGLLEINLDGFGSDSLLTYIADRSSNLRSFGLEVCYPMRCKGLVNAVAKLPLLEELEVSYSWTKLNFKAIGHSCPRLKTLKLNCSSYMRTRGKFDADALGIAKSMSNLHHLQLIGNKLTDIGLNAILDNIPRLDHLDLRQCFNVNLVGNLEKRCSERIKCVRRPEDSTADYPFDTYFGDSGVYLEYSGSDFDE